MKKAILSLVYALIISATSLAQLTGIKSIPGDYPTIAAAITALNSSGVGTGGVTFNVAAGHTETFTSPTAGRITTLTGSVSNPIVFQKSGTGNNPVITSGTGVALMDAIIAIAGCDYITFDGINVKDKLTNFNANQKMEWGFAILKNSASEGSQNITIRNCTVTLTKEYDYTIGIHSNNHLLTSPTQLTVTASSGTNSNLKIYNNSLLNCYTGIYLKGYNQPSAPYQFYDQNNEIGVNGGNTINNVAGQSDPGYGIFTIYQNNLKVANNTITSTMGGLSSAAKPYGIYLSTALNASCDLYNNTVTMNYSGDPYSDFYGIYSEMGGSGNSNTVNVYNNTVTGCTYPTAGSGWIYYMKFINMGVITNVYNNVVSNNTSGSTSLASTGRIDYLWCKKENSIQGPMIMHGNSVTGNTRFSNASVGQPQHFIAASGNGTTLEMYDNLIDNNIAQSNHAIHGLYVIFNDSEYKKVYNNTITNITEIRGSADGLHNYDGTLGYFYNNKIQNIKASPSATFATIMGIYQHDYGKEMYFYNNLITDLSNPGTDVILGTDWNQLTGIYIDLSQNRRGLYNNTVYLNSPITGTQANFGSSALVVHYIYNIDIRNNILVNTSQSIGTEGKTVAIRERIPGIGTFTSNYNDLYAGTPSPKNLIFWDGLTGAQTLNDYKTLVCPQELQSVTELPPFVNVSTQPWDVHLNSAIPTQCESGGFAVSNPFPIIDDFDGDPRYPNPGYPVHPSYPAGAPDIGADEVGGIPSDVTSPSIIYSPLHNTHLTNERTLFVSVTDPSGVPINGIGLPILYWKINNGPYWPFLSQWVSGSSYSFTFGEGTNLGDVVSYFVVVQDNNTPPNVGSFPSLGAGGFTANPPACSVPPSNPSTYTIVSPISGEFHVGVGKPYVTLTAAVNDLNSKGIAGPVTFILDDNSYPGETFPINILPNFGSSASNTVTIRANTGAFPVISGSMPGSCLLELKGFDYLILDGSDGSSSTRRIKFENTAPDDQSYTIGFTDEGYNDASTNITMKNCIVVGNKDNPAVETHLVRFGVNGGGDNGGYDNFVFDNNQFIRSNSALYITATYNNPNHNLVISNNIIGSPNETDYITRLGITLNRCVNSLITGNDIMGPALGAGTYQLIGIGYYQNSTGTKITNNKIHDWISSSTGSYGIKCQNDDPDTYTEISNNLIYNIGAYGLNPGVAASQAHGIFNRHGGNIRIWNNTIYMSGDWLYGGDSYAPSSSCIAFWNQSPVNANNIDIRNNILKNSMTNSYPNPDPLAIGKAYGIMFTNAVTFSVLDNNDYYIDGYQGQIAQQFCVGGTCLINYPTLASWQAYTGMEANSVNVNPQFTSPTNLLPTTTLMNNEGVYIPEVPTDYTGKFRSNPCDIGAYEFAVDMTFDLKVYLEGPFNTSSNTMNTNLQAAGYVPYAQPYNPTLPYFGNNAPKWLYAGTENVTSVPAGVVDWVIVELRDAASAATAGPATIIPGGTRAAFLKSDGSIVNAEGNPNLLFAGVPVSQNLFVVIHHRSHLAIMSSGAVTQTGGIYSWDFTTAQGQAYNNGQKFLSSGHYGMRGGDGNGDALVNSSDKTSVWNIQAGKKGYSASDFNMNGEVSNPDKNGIWLPNLGTGSSVQF